MDPITARLMQEPEKVPNEHNTYSLYNSNESLTLSSDSAPLPSDGEGKGKYLESGSKTTAARTSRAYPDAMPVKDFAMVDEARVEFSEEEEEEEGEGEETEGDGEEGEEAKDGDKDEGESRRSEDRRPCGCRAYGEGLQRGTVAGLNTFFIDTVEADQGEVTVSVEGPYERSVSGTEVYPLEEAPGVYQVQFQVTASAHYHVVITWAGQHLPGSPFTCIVE
ncbi:Filamin-A-like 1 [Homarus americanus]|uniref:Filamin-A-like 1 n=2 Tax=Homarus americanus TaxID=6706 RepID=A0A8J5JS88_HOMAM|nr:Filamin-A-like 1 [Homarus americanus]